MKNNDNNKRPWYQMDKKETCTQLVIFQHKKSMTHFFCPGRISRPQGLMPTAKCHEAQALLLRCKNEIKKKGHLPGLQVLFRHIAGVPSKHKKKKDKSGTNIVKVTRHFPSL
jgi:hypothetical protein